MICFILLAGTKIGNAQEADDGSQPQRTMLSIGSGLQGGDFVSLSLIEAGENKVELQVESGESVSSLIDRLVSSINETASTSILINAEKNATGKILLTGKTKGQDIAVYFGTSGADVLSSELVHRAVPPNETMIP